MARILHTAAACLATLLLAATCQAQKLGREGVARRSLVQMQPEAPYPDNQAGLIAGAAAGGLACLIALVLSLLAWRQRRNPCATGKRKSSDHGLEKTNSKKEGKAKAQAIDIKSPKSPGEEQAPTLYNFTFNDIQVSTDGFRPDGLLSESSYHSVYRGEGPNGEQWAIKCAKEVTVQGEHLFRNEVEFLARVRHSNLVQLNGFCDEEGEQILVFEMLQNGSLAQWLRPHPEDNREPLSFISRYNIAVEVAEAIGFLHSFTNPKIIHRDIRAETVLLDQDFKSKLGGLGLLKHLPGDGLRSRMVSRKGYLDPEYFHTFKVTSKCDVYSFGVVLLELLTACAPMVEVTQSVVPRQITLAQWAKQAIDDGRLEEILDPRMPLQDDTQFKEMLEGFAKVACACVTPLRRHRPDISTVILQLKKLKPSLVSSSSRMFSRMIGGGGCGPRGASKVVPGDEQ